MVPQPELNTPYTQNNYNEAGLHSLWGVHFPSIPSEWALPHPGTLTVTAVTETGTIQLNITSSIRCSLLLFHQIKNNQPKREKKKAKSTTVHCMFSTSGRELGWLYKHEYEETPLRNCIPTNHQQPAVLGTTEDWKKPSSSTRED